MLPNQMTGDHPSKSSAIFFSVKSSCVNILPESGNPSDSELSVRSQKYQSQVTGSNANRLLLKLIRRDQSITTF